jgi:hypothetical protein
MENKSNKNTVIGFQVRTRKNTFNIQNEATDSYMEANHSHVTDTAK